MSDPAAGQKGQAAVCGMPGDRFDSRKGMNRRTM